MQDQHPPPSALDDVEELPDGTTIGVSALFDGAICISTPPHVAQAQGIDMNDPEQRAAHFAANRRKMNAYRVRRMFTPPRGAGAEMLDGGAASVAGRIVEIVRERLG